MTSLPLAYRLVGAIAAWLRRRSAQAAAQLERREPSLDLRTRYY